jgi:hypothetical protein
VLAAGLLALSAGSAVAKPGAYKVLLLVALDGACSGSTATTFQQQLSTEPGIAAVSSVDASTATPTAAQLDPYDLVVTDSDCNGFADGATLGNNLVSYVKQGGVVVEYDYGVDTRFVGDEITGDWVSEGYSPLVAGTNVNDPVTLGTYDASSPLMAGVNGLTAPICDTNSTLAPGATSVAQWSNGLEAVVYKGQAIAVNTSIENGCQSGGDYARLTLNAVTWRGRHYLSVKKKGKGKGKVKSRPAGIKCGKTCKAIYNFGSKVKLTAKPSTGSKFAGWSGACKGKKKTCTVTMNATEKVKAKFKRST